MKKNILLGILLASIANATPNNFIDVPKPLATTGDATVSNDTEYYKYQINNSNRHIEIIYAKENLKYLNYVINTEEKLHNQYEKAYNWKLDDTLHVGLISNSNQIANGFSFQWPNNRQINYLGGTQVVDYFASTSWLDTLLYHETAHNYQTNVKGSKVSRTLHSVFGNGTVLSPMIPVTNPAAVENPFLLEGNAVLNEAWHGKGGRLYSGRFKALAILQAKAGNIKPENVYNDRLVFPYSGSVHYIIGGHYNLYMAEKYGLKKMNSFFKNNSKRWFFPYLTNLSMIHTVGVDFETTIREYADTYAKMGKDFISVGGEHIASSQSYTPLSNDENEIYFMTNKSGHEMPTIFSIDKSTMKTKATKTTLISGKIIKVDDKYLTQAGSHTSATKITQGLYDSDGYIQKDTQGKMIQGYLSDARAVYFDVKSSFDYPQLYVGSEYYGYTNSSVYIDKDDNIYYFANKDKGKSRTLYKNKTPLYTYQGFYGIVCDVDTNGAVYFIANSRLGSTLYKYANQKVVRVSKADNILGAKLINDDEVLLSAISDKDYYYVKNKLITLDQEPFETKLYFEDKPFYGATKVSKENTIKHKINLNASTKYIPTHNLNYSGTDLLIKKSVDDTTIGSLNAKFGDPLTQNSANIFISKDEDNITIAGIGYENRQYLLQYYLSAYGVVDKDDKEDIRDNGFLAGLLLPVYRAGYYYGYMKLTYFQDYNSLDREPLSLSATITTNRQYGHSMYLNSFNKLSLYAVKERKDNIIGGAYDFTHDLPYESYFSFATKYSKSNANITDAIALSKDRGVKLDSNSFYEDMDVSVIDMPTISYLNYTKSAGYVEFGLTKVINLSSYWFTFPFSLQREAISCKFRHYDIKTFDNKKKKVNESMVGLQIDTVFMNKIVLPFLIEYYHNDSEDYTTNKNKVIFSINSTF